MKKKFNPLDETFKLGQVSAGTMFAAGTPHMIGKNLPSTQSTANRISSTTGKVLPIIPLTQGAHSAFRSLGSLQDIEKKTKKRRR
jgi:hypothetical protein